MTEKAQKNRAALLLLYKTLPPLGGRAPLLFGKNPGEITQRKEPRLLGYDCNRQVGMLHHLLLGILDAQPDRRGEGQPVGGDARFSIKQSPDLKSRDLILCITQFLFLMLSQATCRYNDSTYRTTAFCTVSPTCTI